MGKSSKKAKSDRINALRKQYDAFLDEDKKRKHRNEYILGWLDRVRSAPSLTPSRHKENPCFSQDIIRKEPEFITQKYQILDPRATNTIATNTKNLDEITILKEISKNYILIPKKHSTGENIYRLSSSSSNTTNDSDWKSKYNILDELKNNEKGICLKEEPTKDISKDNVNQMVPKEVYEGIDKKSNAQNLPMKIEFIKKSINKPQEPEKICAYDDYLPHVNKNNGEVGEDSNQNINNISYLTSETSSNDNKMVMQIANENNVMKSPEKLLSKLVIKTQDNVLDKPEMLSIQQNNKHENKIICDNTVEESNVPKNMDPTIDYTNTENLESAQPIMAKNINATGIQDTIHIENTNIHTDINKAEDSSNVDPDMNESNMQYQSEIVSNVLTENDMEGTQEQIEEYETEQNQLFYSDETNQNYAYNDEERQNIQSGNEAYDNTNYSYYEAVKDENNYGTDINEHAESTERYDPNYEQQYINQYQENQGQYPNEYVEKEFYNVPGQNVEYDQNQYENFEQQNYEYEQTNIPIDQQQYNNVNAYNNPEQGNQDVVSEHNVPQQNVPDESTEQVEKQMDLEDGYIGDHNIAESQKIIENKNSVEVTQEIKQTT